MLLHSKTGRSCFSIFCALSACILLCNIQGTQIVAADIPSNVRDGLQRNVLDPFSISWTQRRSSKMDINAFINRVSVGRNFLGFFEPREDAFMWQAGCAYLYTLRSRVITGGSIADYSLEEVGLTTAMDGQNYYIGHSKKDSNMSEGLSVFPISMTMEKDQQYPVFSQSYLPFIGLKFPTYGSELNTTPRSYVLFLLDNGKLIRFTEDLLEGEKTLRFDIESDVPFMDILDGTRLFSIWIVPDYNFAVRRIDIKTLSNQLLLSAVNDDFRKVIGKDIFIPHKTSVDFYSFASVLFPVSDGPLYTLTCNVSEVSVKKIDVAQFDLQNKFQQAGAMVSDRTLKDTGEVLTYITPANPADLDRVIEAALTGKDFVPTPIRPSFFALIFRWGLAIFGLCMIIYALVSMSIKHRNRSS